MPVHADGGDRLVSNWIDHNLTAFQPQMQDNAHGIATTVKTRAQLDEYRADQRETETQNFTLPVRH
jgi:hypothetical protein